MFAGGQGDRLRLAQANWRQHEFATPIGEVLTHLRAAEAGTIGADRAELQGLIALLDGLPN